MCVWSISAIVQLSGGPLRSFARSGPISGLALDLVAVLASLEGLVVVGVPGGHEGLDESAKQTRQWLFENVYIIPRN